MEDQAGGELESVLEGEAVEGLDPGVAILEVGEAEGEGVVETDVEAAAGGEGEGVGVGALGVVVAIDRKSVV